MGLVALSQSPCSAAAGVWRFTQRSEFIGDVVLFVKDDAIRIQAASNRWVLIARAPDWSITLFNPTKKLMARRTLKDWNDFGLRSFWPLTKEGSAQVVKLRERRMVGIQAVDYAVPHFDRKGRPVSLSLGYFASYSAAKDLKPRREIITCVLGLHGTTRMRADGMPLLYRRQTASEKKTYMPPTSHGEFWTREATRLTVPDSFFTVPKSLKLIQHEMHIIVDADKSKAFESVLTEMGVGDGAAK